MPRAAPPLRTALAVACAIAAGCSEERPGRALVVGLDGASMRVVLPLLERGELPHLASLAVQGVSGTIRSQLPLDSPPVWNSIVTGVEPRRHGIRGFAYEGEEHEKRLFLSSDRKVPAVWNIVDAAGFSVGIVNFWNTYPPDRVKGVMISDHVLEREVSGRALIAKAEAPERGTTVHPEEWAQRIDELLDDETPLTGVANPFRENHALPKWVLVRDLVRRYEEDEALGRIALAIEREVRPDLLMVLLPGVDRVSHHLWGNVEPAEKYPPRLRPDDAARAAGRRALEDYYRYADEILGLLMRDFGERDLVMVLSDHGFEAGTALMYLTGKHTTEEAIDGIFFARAPGIDRPGGAPGEIGVLDVTPTLLAWFGLPVAEDMDGAPMPCFESSRGAATVATYEHTPIEKVTSAPSGAEEEILERLRMIGYLEDPPAASPGGAPEDSAGAPGPD
jgi:predicted AlkP superfamily pyrophosphatase or phosphodiesterase